jgi:hypothetical protein
MLQIFQNCSPSPNSHINQLSTGSFWYILHTKKIIVFLCVHNVCYIQEVPVEQQAQQGVWIVDSNNAN